MLAQAQDGAILADFPALAASVALAFVDLGRKDAYGSALGDSGFEEQGAIGFFHIAVQIGRLEALLARKVCKIGCDGCLASYLRVGVVRLRRLPRSNFFQGEDGIRDKAT